MFPDVPTFKELGYPDLEFTVWFGFAAPARTPVAVLDKLNADIVRVLQMPEVRAKLKANGFLVTGTTRDEFARIVREDTARWAKAVKATGFKATE